MNKQLLQILLLFIGISTFLNAEVNLWYNQENPPFLGKDRFIQTDEFTQFSLKHFQTGLSFVNPNLESSQFSHFLTYNASPISGLKYSVLGAVWAPGYFKQYQIDKSSFSIGAYNQSQTFQDSQIDSNQFSLAASHQLSSNVRISGRAELSTTQSAFDNVLYDRDTYSLPISVFYTLSSDLDVSLNYKKSYTHSSDSNLIYNDDTLTLGLHSKVSPNLQTDLNIGLQSRENQKGDLDQKIAGGSSIRYKVNESTEIASSLSKDYAIGPKGENMEKVQTTLELDFALNELMLVGTNVAMLNYEYIDTGEETDLANAGLHFKYKDGDLLNLSAGYSVSTPDFDRKLNKRMGHLLNFSASIQF